MSELNELRGRMLEHALIDVTFLSESLINLMFSELLNLVDLTIRVKTKP